MLKNPEQDQIYDYTFLFEGNEVTVRFSNPILNDEVTFDIGSGDFKTMKCIEIIEASHKRVNVITGTTDVW